MDEIKVDEEMMDVLQMVADATKLKRDNPERYDVLWKMAEHEIMNMVKDDCTEENPTVAMLKESITHSIIEAIRNDPSVMLELEQFAQENEES